MEKISYTINKGVNRTVEFKGLKGQYIFYLAGGITFLLVGSSILYIAAVPVYLLLPVVGLAGFGLFSVVFRLNHRYGEHGLMKALARRRVPAAIFCLSRKVFRKLRNEVL